MHNFTHNRKWYSFTWMAPFAFRPYSKCIFSSKHSYTLSSDWPPWGTKDWTCWNVTCLIFLSTISASEAPYVHVRSSAILLKFLGSADSAEIAGFRWPPGPPSEILGPGTHKISWGPPTPWNIFLWTGMNKKTKFWDCFLFKFFIYSVHHMC